MAPKRILVVEDNQVARSGLTEILCAEGYNAQSAANGLEALSAASRLNPECAIIDVALADVDGISLIQRVQEQFPGCSCVVTSAWSDVWIDRQGEQIGDHSEQAIEAGAVAFFRKPLNLDDLLDVLKRTLA